MNALLKNLARTTAGLFIVTAIAVTAEAGTLLLADVKVDPGFPSTAADFQAYDASVDAGASVNDVFGNGSVVSSANASFSATFASGGGPTNTNKGAGNDVPILDGYFFRFNQIGATVDVTGLSTVAGDVVTLSLFGAEDSGQETAFRVTYNGITFPNQITDFNSPLAQFSFFADAGADGLLIEWGRPDGDFSGASALNGLSLTSRPIPEPTALALLVFSLGGVVVCRR